MVERSWRGRGGVVCAAVTASFVMAAGCGRERPPPGGDTSFTPGSSTSGTAADGGHRPPPGCGQKDDGSYCDCLDVPLFADPPNLYFVLDHSGSMSDEDKWDSVRVTMGRVLRAIGPRAQFGAAWFPNRGGDTCAPGAEIMPVRPGDPPGAVDGATTQYLLTVTNVPPYGGTSTAATLQALLPRIRAYPGKTFVILATDGGPNCNGSAACDANGCMPNIEGAPGCQPGGPPNCCETMPKACLDAEPTISAVTAYRGAGIPVYVIGIPGSAPYATLLDSLAVAGGTALATSPRYFRVDTASSSDLLATLKRIAAKIIATCEFKLKEAPQDPSLVNVYLDEEVLPQQGNWKIEGSTVTLLGAQCSAVLAGDVLGVRIITGCPTVIR